MATNCKECDRELFGRIDKKFCSDQCRTSYNNRANREGSIYMRKVNKILKKNHKILVVLNPNGKMKISKEKMSDKGFNFDYFTNIYTTKKGRVYHFCYDQGYIFLEDDMVALVVRKSYLDK